ncbi:MAG: major facilitator superfamily 1 [Anaerocolumna sp.]|jgi:MFS family permease|nr:major facilitator superfamily 1 [Anaerocolumna sp.]
MKLNYRRTLLISLAFMSICAFWQLYDTIIPLILQNTFHLGETVTGTVMALDNILAVFLLPVFGAFSDKVDTRFGKRIPFILFGTIGAVILMMILPIADARENLFVFVAVLLVLLITMGSYRSPAVALMPDVTPKPLRSKANALINLMGAAGAVYSLLMIKKLIKQVEKPDYTQVFLAVAILMLVTVAILVSTIREKKIAIATVTEDEDEILEAGTNKLTKDVQRSLIFLLASIFLWFMAYNAVTTAFSRYAIKVWDLKGGDFADCLMVATVAAILSYIPIGFLSGKFGRKKTIIAGIILLASSYFAGMLFTEYSAWVNVVFAITGIAWAAINVNSYPMVVQMSKGSDVGRYTGLYYTFSMSAQVITPIASGSLLEHVSYRSLFPYAVIFSLLSLCTMIFVKHGDVRPDKKDSILENFDS